MAKQEFIANLRTARNLFAHAPVPAVTAPSDAAPSDAAAADQMAARGAVWIRPQSVKGFDVAEFTELDDHQKAELQAAVDEFSHVANQIGPGTIVTPEQVAQATTPFETILSILQRYLPRSPEETDTEEALKNLPFPPWVVNWDFELGNDFYDDPALFLYLFIANDDDVRREMVQDSTRLFYAVRDILSGMGSDRFPFINFRKAVEYVKR